MLVGQEFPPNLTDEERFDSCKLPLRNLIEVAIPKSKEVLSEQLWENLHQSLKNQSRQSARGGMYFIDYLDNIIREQDEDTSLSLFRAFNNLIDDVLARINPKLKPLINSKVASVLFSVDTRHEQNDLFKGHLNEIAFAKFILDTEGWDIIGLDEKFPESGTDMDYVLTYKYDEDGVELCLVDVTTIQHIPAGKDINDVVCARVREKFAHKTAGIDDHWKQMSHIAVVLEQESDDILSYNPRLDDETHTKCMAVFVVAKQIVADEPCIILRKLPLSTEETVLS